MPTKREPQGGLRELNHKTTEIILDRFGRKDIILQRKIEQKNAMGHLKGYHLEKSTITGDLQFVNYQDKQLLKEGYVKIGDGLFYCVHNTDLKENDEIIVDNVNWILNKRVEAETIGDGRIYQAWTCVRKNDD